jgi:hypothetical protein
MRTSRRLAILTLLVALPVLAAAKGKAPARWTIATIEVEGQGDKASQDAVAAKLRALLDTTDGFAPLPEGTPDWKADPDGFGKIMAGKKLKAYGVRIKLTKLERTLVPVTGKPGSRDQMLSFTVELELLGVALPKSTFGFTGKGDATVSAEVGPTVSPRLDANVRDQAFDMALTRALAQATTELAKKPQK